MGDLIQECVLRIKSMKRFIQCTFVFLLAVPVFGNTAQPGFWGAGGTGTFSLLYPEDSSEYQKIQMVDELVTIKLFDGFAVVKGTYYMYNTTPDSVFIKAGYPINSIFESEIHHDRADIKFDELFQLRTTINNVPVRVLKDSIADSEYSYQKENWYVWQNKFAPKDTTVIEVCFLVNTKSSVLMGYARDQVNGFIYLLECGSTWKQPIVHGRIQVLLDKSINLEDIKGTYPDTIFSWNEESRLLYFEFDNLSPTPNNNIIISHELKNDDFDFSGVVADADLYFDELVAFERSPLVHVGDPKRFGDPFHADGSFWSPFTIIAIVFFGSLAILIGLIIVLVKAFTKKRK